jgi:anti-anti-sigma factor
MLPPLGEVASGRRDGTRFVRLRGEFDLSNAWKLEDALMDAIGRHGEDIVVDLTEVRFMDAQLVRALIRGRNAAQSRELGFIVVPPADRDVWRVARLTALPLAA